MGCQASKPVDKKKSINNVSPVQMPKYRCDNCGNKTRFDVVATERSTAFFHYSLGGELSIESREILNLEVETVTCRWCGSTKSIVDDASMANEV